MPTGAFPDDVTRQLEALKLKLVAMTDADLDGEQARAMTAEISAIRLQLQRLALEREWVEGLAKRALDD